MWIEVIWPDHCNKGLPHKLLFFITQTTDALSFADIINDSKLLTSQKWILI